MWRLLERSDDSIQHLERHACLPKKSDCVDCGADCIQERTGTEGNCCNARVVWERFEDRTVFLLSALCSDSWRACFFFRGERFCCDCAREWAGGSFFLCRCKPERLRFSIPSATSVLVRTASASKVHCSGLRAGSSSIASSAWPLSVSELWFVHSNCMMSYKSLNLRL